MNKNILNKLGLALSIAVFGCVNTYGYNDINNRQIQYGIQELSINESIPSLFTSENYIKETSANESSEDDSGIYGSWNFSLGDYYYDDSSMETLIAVYEASALNGYVYFEEADEAYLPMAALYNEKDGTLTFTQMNLGDFYGYGFLVQLPFQYDAENEKLIAKSELVGKFDPETLTLTFENKSGIQWYLFNEIMNPMFSLDAYDFEGAVKSSVAPNPDPEPGPGPGEEDGIEDVVNESVMPNVFYNLQGIKISEPCSGTIVLKRDNKSVSKIIIK